MRFRTLLAYSIVIICIILLAGSYFQWKAKLDSVKASPDEQTSESPRPSSKGSEASKVEPTMDKKRLVQLMANQEDRVRAVFKNRLGSGENLQFLIVGSEAMNGGNPGYAERLKVALEESYGDFVQVSTVPFDGTTDKLIAGLDEELIDLESGYDVILFEPLTLKNNGLIALEDGFQHINEFRTRVQSKVKDAVVVLHPPQPLLRATFYPREVEALRVLAESEEIPYVNHWLSWPDKDSEALVDLLDDQSMPNDKGATIWANELIKYFIADKTED